MDPRKPILLTVKEVTTLLRVQRPKIYDLIRDGVLDGFKVGADWRIRTDSLEQLIGPIPLDFFEGLEDAPEDSGDSMSSLPIVNRV